MSELPHDLAVAKCGTCHYRFLGTEATCPRCASRAIETVRVPALGTVLAATDVVYPAEGWSAPHRLALVEIAEAVRLLAVVEGSLPAVGALVALDAGPSYVRARAEPPSG